MEKGLGQERRFLSLTGNIIPVTLIRWKRLYWDTVLKPLTKLDLPEETKVHITLKGSFSELLDELGEMEAKNDINKVLADMRTRDYYE